jgi:pimeloyl-ACP methyl ester carboxylesterase
MEFLVEFTLDLPDGVALSEVHDREEAEAVAAAKLAREGHLVRVWKRSGGSGDVTTLDKTGRRIPALLKDATLLVIDGGSHAIPWTHADQVNTAMLQFIGAARVATGATR